MKAPEGTPVTCPPHMVRVIKQNGMHADCSVASLATLFGTTYDEALIVAGSVQPAVLGCGMTWREMRLTAKRMGGKTRLLRSGQYDIEEATGILCVKRDDSEHVVFLWEGRIVDGNGELWLSPQDYLTHYKYRATGLLVRVE